jgi:hypothetical protein
MKGDESNGCTTGSVSPTWSNCIREIPPPASDPNAVENFANSRNTSIDGFSLPLSAQLLAPPFESLPGSPRPFVQAGYYFFLSDEFDTLAADGPQPEDFNKLRTDPTRPQSRLRIELLGEPKSRWFAGFGAAFRLPVDTYEVYLKPSVNYAEERIDVTGQITSTVADPPPIPTPTGQVEFSKTNAFVDSQVVREISLGLGLDVLIGKLGPMGVGLAFDLFASFPVDGGKTRFVVANPCDKGGCNPAGSGAFSADVGQTQFLGSVGLRLSWLGE